MKKILFIGGMVFLVLGLAGAGLADPLEELLDEFSREYEALKPPTPYSSVSSDYKLGQAALGTLYTTKALGLLYQQNKQLAAKYDEMLRKYDQIIEQNKEIIRMLSIIVKRSAPREEPLPGQ